MTQTERISHMENCLNDSRKAIDSLAHALEMYRDVQGKLRELSSYYDGEEWRKDFADDEAGRLPTGLKRGVLSEDAVYDLLNDNREILDDMAGLIREREILNV